MKYNKLNKFFYFLRSMKFGISLLIIIMLISIIGSVIPQGMDEQFYSSSYSPFITKLVMILNLNDIYNSGLFGTLFLFLTLNLLMCSIVRLSGVVNKIKSKPLMEKMEHLSTENVDSYDSNEDIIESSFKKYGFKKINKDEPKSGKYFSMKNKAGFFGSWLLHLGILLVIVFYAYGNATFFSEGVYGIPGSTQSINSTDYKVRILDFNIEHRDDGTVQQYTSKVELLHKSGEVLKSSNVSVNSPMRYDGYTFYQSAYGWTANCSVSKSGNNIYQNLVYEKTILNIPDENIGIYFNSFYPDFVQGTQGYISLSDQLKNPFVLYTVVYYGQVVKMGIAPIGETFKWNEYEFTFQEPQRYTYLDVNKMNGQLGAVIGAILTTIGLMLVFYFKPKGMLIHIQGSKMLIYKYEPLGKSYKINKQREKNIYAK